MTTRYKNLAQFFPMIRTEELVRKEIAVNPAIKAIFDSWRIDQQEEFLSICTGNKGVKMLYDSYFKEILNPEENPERLSDLLSELIGRKVTVKCQLPNDNSRLGDEMSLVITDIVVELEDGTIANVEVQKLGYKFTGERASCYSADLLLRQYKRARDTFRKDFTYKNISPVYTIVLLENSPGVFKEFEDKYVYTFFTVSDTGIELNMLQNFIFVPVDIFLKKLHNEGMETKLDAWLTFLGCDEPEFIIDLIQKYPSFKPLYDDLYDLCLNTERMVNMFSEELQILDRNTVKYMIDELQEQLDSTQEEFDILREQLEERKELLDSTNEQLKEKKEQLDAANALIQKYKEKFGEI